MRRTGRRVRGEAREEAAAAARRTGASLRADLVAVGASRTEFNGGDFDGDGGDERRERPDDAAADDAAADPSSSSSAPGRQSSKARSRWRVAATAASAALQFSRDEVWPLQLVDLRDEDQVEELYQLLRLTPEVVEYYLDGYVFPRTARHQGMKLSATGQELGGDLIFPRRLGFSGTPADLLPLELGAPKFEPGTDAKVLASPTSLRTSGTTRRSSLCPRPIWRMRHAPWA